MQSAKLEESLERYMANFEKPIDAKAFILIPTLQPSTEEAKKVQIEFMNSGINLLNDYYKELISKIYLEISLLFKQARAITIELYDKENKDNEKKNAQRTKLHELFANIRKKQNVLEIIRSKKDRDSAFQISLLNAKDLVILSSVLSLILEQFTAYAKAKAKEDQFATAIEQIHALNRLLIERMKSKLAKEKKHDLLSQSDRNDLKNSNITKSFVNVPSNEDKTYDGEVPPTLNESVLFNSIPEYFLTYIYIYSKEDREWLEKERNFKTQPYFKERVTATMKYYSSYFFNPETNPYVGLLQDAGNEIYGAGNQVWQNYGKDVYSTFINTFRGNSLAIAVIAATDKLADNDNFQKIQNQWSEGWSNVKRVVQKTASKIKETYARETKTTIDLTPLANEDVNTELLCKELEIASKNYEEAWVKLSEDWIKIEPENLHVDSKTDVKKSKEEQNDLTEEERLRNQIKGLEEENKILLTNYKKVQIEKEALQAKLDEQLQLRQQKKEEPELTIADAQPAILIANPPPNDLLTVLTNYKTQHKSISLFHSRQTSASLIQSLKDLEKCQCVIYYYLLNISNDGKLGSLYMKLEKWLTTSLGIQAGYKEALKERNSPFRAIISSDPCLVLIRNTMQGNNYINNEAIRTLTKEINNLETDFLYKIGLKDRNKVNDEIEQKFTEIQNIMPSKR